MSGTWAPRFYHPSHAEVAGGIVTGSVEGPDRVASCYAGLTARATPRRILEELVWGALARPPCVVSFSGGRDSSALLAVAAAVARREGLPMPVAVTFRYEGEAKTEESTWQETVIRHVGITDWEKLDIGMAHDVLSDEAQTLMRSHGLVFPASLSAKVSLHARARGGSAMSGEGGDEIFGTRRATVFRRLIAKPPRVLRRGFRGEAAIHLGPRKTRLAAYRRDIQRRLTPVLTYLRPGFLEQVIDDLAWHLSSEPFGNTASLGWHLRRKQIVKHQEGLSALASEHGVQHVDPFLEPKFVAAYARMVKPFGLPTRTHAMTALFSDLLPPEVLGRTSKAVFNRAMITDISRAFARDWAGGGVDTALVDPEALRSAWLSDWPPFPSLWLLQSAWLFENALPQTPPVALT